MRGIWHLVGMAAVVAGVALLGLLARRWLRREPDRLIDALIGHCGVRTDGRRSRYVGFDPEIRARATARREKAAVARREADRIAMEPINGSAARSGARRLAPFVRRVRGDC